ncbi:MAG TPA: acyl carrier protein [Candidatus Angelobacter sp.]
MPGVEQMVRQIIAGQLGLEVSQVSNHASFADDLGADSLDRMELIVAFEETFNLQIPEPDAEKISTVQEAVDYIEKNAKSVKQ